MAAKLIIFALCASAAFASVPHVAQYPAGVSPHTCPNYPYCDNVALAAHALAPYAAPAYAHYGVHGAVAAAYPAGVDPLTCPNYPYCDNVALAAHAAGAYGWAGAHPWAAHAAAHAAAHYPAGVSPHTCPNYPFCH